MYRQLSDNFDDCVKQIEYEDIRNFLIETNKGNIPKSFPYSDIWKIHFDDPNARFKLHSELMFAREVYTHFCSWSIVTDDWVSEIVNLLKGKKCIEIIAGNGLLSHALQMHGVDVTPYDDFSWACHNNFTTVYNMDAVECAEKLDYDFIICSWPPYQGFEIAEVVKKMYFKAEFKKKICHKRPNIKMIYIGEDQGGCTACDRFFDTMDEITGGKEADIIKRANSSFSRFEGIHDYIYLMKPNHKAGKYTKRMNKYADEIY